jgi:hypothetical protein
VKTGRFPFGTSAVSVGFCRSRLAVAVAGPRARGRSGSSATDRARSLRRRRARGPNPGAMMGLRALPSTMYLDLIAPTRNGRLGQRATLVDHASAGKQTARPEELVGLSPSRTRPARSRRPGPPLSYINDNAQCVLQLEALFPGGTCDV